MTTKELLYLLISISGIIIFLLGSIGLVIWNEIAKIRATRHEHEKNLIALDGRTQLMRTELSVMKNEIASNSRQLQLALTQLESPIIAQLRAEKIYERAKRDLEHEDHIEITDIPNSRR